MKVFGKGWANRGLPRCDVPLGAVCLSCGNTFEKDDLGVLMPFFGSDLSAFESGTVAYHRDCLMKELGLEPKK